MIENETVLEFMKEALMDYKEKLNLKEINKRIVRLYKQLEMVHMKKGG